MTLSSWRKNWPAVALVASLVLNGFLIGMVAADSFRDRSHGHRSPRVFNFELRRLADRLPPEALDRIAAELEPLAPELQPHYDHLRALRDEINGMAAAPTPDRAAIDALLRRLRVESAAMQEAVQKATFDALLRLPPESRAGLARPPDRN
jgi:uncharacterized membrane protein